MGMCILKIYTCSITVVELVGFEGMLQTESSSTSQGLPYDFSSIMHCQHNVFSSKLFASSVVPRNRSIPKTVLGSSVRGTRLDFLHINILYCEGTRMLNAYNVVELVDILHIVMIH